MSKYTYFWDNNNKKKIYGGKYEKVTPKASGYYDNNDAGDKQYFKNKDWGTPREFIGSKTQEYTFSDTAHGTHTITAESFEEALRIAESVGYTHSDYKPRKGKQRGRR